MCSVIEADQADEAHARANASHATHSWRFWEPKRHTNKIEASTSFNQQGSRHDTTRAHYEEEAHHDASESWRQSRRLRTHAERYRERPEALAFAGTCAQRRESEQHYEGPVDKDDWVLITLAVRTNGMMRRSRNLFLPTTWMRCVRSETGWKEAAWIRLSSTSSTRGHRWSLVSTGPKQSTYCMPRLIYGEKSNWLVGKKLRLKT